MRHCDRHTPRSNDSTIGLKGLLVFALLQLSMAGKVDAQHWSVWMTGDSCDLISARQQFDAQRDLRIEPRSVGVKPFERWAWWMQERGGLEKTPRPESWWTATENWRIPAATMSSTSADAPVWNYVGPDEIPVHGGAGRINRVRLDPNNSQHWLACAPSGGLWQSFDSGMTWEVLGVDALSPLGATDVWMDPNDNEHLWLATGDGNGGDTYSIGLLETWNGGQSWLPLELTFEAHQGRRIQTMAHHPTGVDTVLVATDLGLFLTSDGGTSFDLVQSGSARDVFWMNDSTAVAAFDNQGVRRSTDVGQTWVVAELPESNNSVGRIQLAAESTELGVARDTLYAVAGHYFQQNFLAVWQSTDAGLTWSVQSTRWTGPNLLGYTINGVDNGGQAFWDLCIEVDPQNAMRLLVGGVNLWESLDGGVSWNCVVHWQGAGESQYAHADQHDIQFLPGGEVLLANDGEVFQWSEDIVVDKSEGLDIAQGYALSIHPFRAATWMLGTQDNGTNLISPKFDARILDGDGFHSVFDTTAVERLYASAYYGLLYRSDDGGRTMSNIANYYQSSGPNELGAWQTPFQMHPAVPGRIVAAKKSLHWSDDGGETWTSTGGMGTLRSTALALSPWHPHMALVAKNAQLHFKDEDATEFTAVEGPSSDYIGDVALSNDSACTWWVAYASYDASGQMWRSSDHGETWENVSSGLPQLPVHRVIQLHDGTWMCGSDMGVHRWNEADQAWELYGTGLPLSPVVDLAEDVLLNRLLVSTYGRGVWSAALPNAPQEEATIIHLVAPPTQCMVSLTGSPQVQNTGTDSLAHISYRIAAIQASSEVVDTVIVTFDTPLAPQATEVLPAFDVQVPTAGKWTITVDAWSEGQVSMGPTYETELWASGLGHQMTLEWWGDCESVDLRWELRQTETEETILRSAPTWPGDTLSSTWCLSAGCYEILWEDEGEDGFSGSYCGEAGGFMLRGPFGDVVQEEAGTDFGASLSTEFCISLPWCYADYNGDGTRSVNDLLSLLSDFGCSATCFADNDQDGSVGVNDLMNMLSVYGSGCEVTE